MAVTSGFFNALNHDRLYDAIQMSSLFDGIITNGIFSTIGYAMEVRATGTGLTVKVRSGRAWFDHCWINNDADYLVELELSEMVLKRIDAVVIEVNQTTNVRDGFIKVVKGSPSSNPQRPNLVHTAEVNQYALAYITLNAGVEVITDSMITNVRGTNETPFITGLLQQLSISTLLTQWETEFDEYFENFTSTSEVEFQNWFNAKILEYNTWYQQMQTDYNTWYSAMQNQYNTWYQSMVDEGNRDLMEFDQWFQAMKDQLSTDAAGHLQAEIDDLRENAVSGSTITVYTDLAACVGRTVTITDGMTTRTGSFDTNYKCVFKSVTFTGPITIETTNGTDAMIRKEFIPYIGVYEFFMSAPTATINISGGSALANTVVDVIEVDAHSRNLLNNSASTYTGDGITFTVNSDKTVDVDGTLTGTSSSLLLETLQDFIADNGQGKYVLTAFTSIEANAKVRVSYRDTNTTIFLMDGGANTDKEWTFTVNAGGTISGLDLTRTIDIKLFINTAGATLNHYLFTPMIRRASDENINYERYCLNNKSIGKVMLDPYGNGSYVVPERVDYKLVALNLEEEVYKAIADLDSTMTSVSVSLKPVVYHTELVEGYVDDLSVVFVDSNIHPTSDITVEYRSNSENAITIISTTTIEGQCTITFPALTEGVDFRLLVINDI